MTVQALRYTRKLLKTQQQIATFAPPGDRYHFTVAPSCPPDKRLHVRGGRNACSWNRGDASWDYAQYRIYTVPDLTADLSDSSSVLYVPEFVVVDYYRAYWLCLRLPVTEEEPTASDWTFYLHGTDDEFETAGEAERWMNTTDFLNYNYLDWDSSYLIGSTYQLCGVVLRGDGIGGVGAFMPIDLVNRGRSYIWPRDIRPRQPSDT